MTDTDFDIRPDVTAYVESQLLIAVRPGFLTPGMATKTLHWLRDMIKDAAQIIRMQRRRILELEAQLYGNKEGIKEEGCCKIDAAKGTRSKA